MEIHIPDAVGDFIENLPKEDRSKIHASIDVLREDRIEELLIKKLKDKVKEIVVKQFRIIFFQIGSVAYIADVYKKQSKKTPPRIIKRAEKIYKRATSIKK